MKTTAEIKAALVGTTTSLSTIVDALTVYFYNELDADSEFKEWIHLERNGYAETDTIPEYRKNILMPLLGKCNILHIFRNVYDEKTGQAMTRLNTLYQPISAIEAARSSDGIKLTIGNDEHKILLNAIGEAPGDVTLCLWVANPLVLEKDCKCGAQEICLQIPN
jgi:hypothetical protein